MDDSRIRNRKSRFFARNRKKNLNLDFSVTFVRFFPTLDVVLRAKHTLTSRGHRRRAEIVLGFCSQQQVLGSNVDN